MCMKPTIWGRFIAHTAALKDQLSAPAIMICDNCLGACRDTWGHDCDACHGRGWCAVAHPLQLLATALMFGGTLVVSTLFLLAVAP